MKLRMFRNSYPGVFLKIWKSSLETPVPESFFNKVSDPKHATILKKRLEHMCFSVNFENF